MIGSPFFHLAGVFGLITVPLWYGSIGGLFGRAQPLVLLVCDMLRVPMGWRDTGDTLIHETGVRFWVSFRRAGSHNYYKLAIDGAEVTLSRADRFRLRRAFRVFEKRQSNAENERAARILADKAKQFAERARTHADKVVNIRGAA